MPLMYFFYPPQPSAITASTNQYYASQNLTSVVADLHATKYGWTIHAANGISSPAASPITPMSKIFYNVTCYLETLNYHPSGNRSDVLVQQAVCIIVTLCFLKTQKSR
jgi:hypothetical protein